jgi:methionyl-tRNA synthetase
VLFRKEENMATFEDFSKLELKVGKILEVAVHPNADKLYVIKVDLGEKTTQLVAGIRNYYTPEELVGKSAVIVVNLEPKMLRGVESNGMLLAAHSEDKIVILTTDRQCLPGSFIK